MAYEEFHTFIDDAVVNRKRLGETRGMIARADRVLDEIDGSGRNVPVWLANALTRLRDALRYEAD